MSTVSLDCPLSADDVLEFLKAKEKTLAPSDPPISAYILGAGFYFEESPTSDRFRSWLFQSVRDIDNAIWLQCELLCLLMLNSPGNPDPTWRGEKKVDQTYRVMGHSEITDWDLYGYLKRLQPIGFRGYSKGSVDQWYPDGKREFPFAHHYSYRKEFRPIEVVKDPEQKSFFETHVFHLMARLNVSETLFGWLVNKRYRVTPEVDDSRDRSSDSDDSEEEKCRYRFPVTDNHLSGLLWRLTALHHAILGLADGFLRTFLKAFSPMFINETDGRRNTFIFAFVELREPKTSEQKAQHLKVWEVVKEELDRAFPEPSALKEFLVRKNWNGRTVLHEAIVNFNFDALAKFLTIFKMDPFATLDAKGNTILHTLADSKGEPKKQLGMLQDLVKLLFDLEPDVEKRERFYQYKNTAWDTALQVAGNAKNKELVQKLVFLPGADAEEKSGAHPKGVDFAGLGIHYGKLLAHECALLFERNLAFGDRLDHQEKVITHVVETVGAVIGELGEAKQTIGVLTDKLERSEQNQLRLADKLKRSKKKQLLLEAKLERLGEAYVTVMQMMGALLADQGRAFPALPGQLAAPFLALGDAAAAGAGAGFDSDEGSEADDGVEQAKGLDLDNE